jgi:hypothetical protein
MRFRLVIFVPLWFIRIFRGPGDLRAVVVHPESFGTLRFHLRRAVVTRLRLVIFVPSWLLIST